MSADADAELARARAAGDRAGAALALAHLGRHVEAIGEFEAVVFAGNAPVALIESYGASLRAALRWDRLAQVREALYAKLPNDATATALVAALMDAGNAERADGVLQALLPRHPRHRPLLALAANHLLRAGDLARGFDLAAATDGGAPDDGGAFASLRLSADPVEALLQSSLLDEVAARGGTCTVACPAALVPLFRRRWPALVFVPPDAPLPAPTLDGLRLAGRCRRDDGAFPARRAWLVADPADREAASAALRANGDTRPLAAIVGDGTDTPDKTLASSALADAGLRVVALSGVRHDDDLDAFAARLTALALVVTADPFTAHLAGALGVRCLLLLPDRGPQPWYVPYAGEAMAWFPSLRLVRIAGDESVDAAARRVATAIHDAAAGDDATPERALALVNARRYAEALPLLERLVDRGATDAACIVACAYARERTGDDAGAIRLLRALHDALPGREQAVLLVSACVRLTRGDDLDALLPELLARYPDDPQLLATASEHALARRDFARGFELAKHRASVAQETSLVDNLPCPEWDGAPFDGTLLVAGEQGLGEELLASSLFADLVRTGQRAIVGADARLVPLLARSFPSLAFVDRRAGGLDARAREPGARKIASIDLGRFYRRAAGDFPAAGGWLSPDIARRDALRAALRAHFPGKRLVGLAWRSHRLGLGGSKSIPAGDLQPLLAHPDCVFIDLQYDAPEVDLALWRLRGLPVHRVAGLDTREDIDGLAALVAALDVVVSCSNSTVHLAGALGTRTLALVPGGRYLLWYWGYDGARTPWYPAVELFRGPPRTAWRDLAAQAAAALDAP